MLGAKLTVWILVGIAIACRAHYDDTHGVEARNAVAYRQFEDDDRIPEQIRSEHYNRSMIYTGGVACWGLLGILLFASDGARWLARMPGRRAGSLAILLLAGGIPGCYRPFEPIKLENIGTSEEGFLIPLRGDKTKQSSTDSEADLRANIVTTKQVQIPQQWVQKGYETAGANGEWQDAAVLIKVDRAPVTREWTADPNSGTSNKNEAIWVMTSDQVEFSTGWTITARITNRDGAIKFLHNYPNGALKDVLDREVRSMLQATFGLEVTDLPMDELRKSATPHIKATTEKVAAFFKDRGIDITNIGITGGFVYKDQSIQKTMVDIFNAEQEKTKARAATDAQDEKNKRLLAEAQGKADALKLEKLAEAEGIKAVADAKAYEISKAQENKEIYIALKRLELESKRQEKWDGRLPMSFIGGGDTRMPEMLLNVPMPVTSTK